jgi:hypothetical protein
MLRNKFDMQLSDTDVHFISTEQTEHPSTSEMGNEQMSNEDPDLYNPGMADTEIDSSGESYLIPS